MMQITVEFAAQLKRAAGTGRETVDIMPAATLRDLVLHVAERHGDSLKPLLLGDVRALHPSILVFINDEQCRDADSRTLKDGDTVAFLSPISGG